MPDQSVDVGLDGLLVRAADQRRLVPGADETLQLAAGPGTPARHRRPPGGSARAGAAKIATGSSERTPARGDRRFGDPAWSKGWLWRRLLQGYLAVGETVDGLIDDAQLDWAHEERVRTVATNLHRRALAGEQPADQPGRAEGDGRGGRREPRPRRAGRSHATPARRRTSRPTTTPSRSRSARTWPPRRARWCCATSSSSCSSSLPSTDEVREFPLVIIPPMISKYYVVDLAPERSLVEYLSGRGQQVFSISWRQPREENADWDLSATSPGSSTPWRRPAGSPRSEKVHVLGLCAGGVATACTLATLADVGELDTVAGATFCVTVLDTDRAGTIASVVDPRRPRRPPSPRSSGRASSTATSSPAPSPGCGRTT